MVDLGVGVVTWGHLQLVASTSSCQPLPSGLGWSSSQLRECPPSRAFGDPLSGVQCPFQVLVLAQVGPWAVSAD